MLRFSSAGKCMLERTSSDSLAVEHATEKDVTFG
jgi:hypothetical protein